MRTALSLKALSYALVAAIAVAMCAPAQATVVLPVNHESALNPALTQVHWEWHHHRRVWVPDRRRY
jgi:hypothetical protein